MRSFPSLISSSLRRRARPTESTGDTGMTMVARCRAASGRRRLCLDATEFTHRRRRVTRLFELDRLGGIWLIVLLAVISWTRLQPANPLHVPEQIPVSCDSRQQDVAPGFHCMTWRSKKLGRCGGATTQYGQDLCRGRPSPEGTTSTAPVLETPARGGTAISSWVKIALTCDAQAGRMRAREKKGSGRSEMRGAFADT